MSENIKNGLKKLARRTENRLAESLLKWKYLKEEKEMPSDERIREESERLTGRANRILSERGKKAWLEIKKACTESREGGDGDD